ncbi:DUF5908 family protein [Methylomonas sp. MgM2]
MPIEIKELHIRVTVNAAPEQATAKKTAGAAQEGEDNGGKDAIVAECIEQVLQILQNKRER